MNDKITKKRIAYLDYLRVISMLGVVFNHIFVTARTDFSNHSQNFEILCWCIRGVMHFCVPIFFMISGFLFLNPKKIITIKDLFKKYILKYIFIILTFGWRICFYRTSHEKWLEN